MSVFRLEQSKYKQSNLQNFNDIAEHQRPRQNERKIVFVRSCFVPMYVCRYFYITRRRSHNYSKFYRSKFIRMENRRFSLIM
jgi:hypothetical protein